MSDSIIQCDSDEELFWGPVTAKEIELLWRSRMAHSKKGERCKTDPKIDEDFLNKALDLNKPPDQSGSHQNNFSSLQEVPSLNFRKSNLISAYGQSVNVDNMQRITDKSKKSSDFDELSRVSTDNISVQENCFSKPDNTNLTDSVSLVASTNTDMLEHNVSKKLNSTSSGKNLSFSNKVEISNSLVTNNQSDDKSFSECYHHLSEKTGMSKEHIFTDFMNSTIGKEKIYFEHNYFKHSPKDGTNLHIQPGINDLNQTVDGATESNYRNDHSAVGLLDIACTQDKISEVRNIKTDSDNLGKMDGENLAVDNSQTVDDSNELNVSSIKKSELFHNVSIVGCSRNSEMDPKCSDSNLNDKCNVVNSLLKQSDEYHSDKNKHKEGVKRESNDFCSKKENVDPSNTLDISNHNLKHENQKETMAESQNHSLVSFQLETNESSKMIDALNNANDSKESSDEKSFVSLSSEDSSSSNNQCVALNQDCLMSSTSTNKENEDPSKCLQDNIKSEISVTNSYYKKTVVLKPSKLQPGPGMDDAKWANDFKLKNIPKPKKPAYMVSPAKLNGILKNHSQPAKQPDKVPLINTKTFSKPNPSYGKSKLKTPKPPLLLTPNKKQFDHIKSPISEYIRSGIGITTAKSLPALQTANNIPRHLSTKQSPVQKLTPKFYSSAEKLIIKQGPSLVSEEKKAKGFLTPRIFKHQGRVVDERKRGEINVVTPRAARTAHLHDASFACLPQTSKKLDISVLEEQ